MRFLLSGLLAAWCSVAVCPAQAAASERRAVPAPPSIEAMAVPAAGAILVDGKLDEAIWSSAPVVADFVQREPAEGGAPSQRTEARIAFDAHALYVAIRAFDTEPGRVVGILTRRDERSPSDWVKVIVDSYNDDRSAYEFAVNPVGVKIDRYYFNDGASDDSWDAVWDVEVARDAEGWRAEFRIPFSQLRFNTTDGGPVGLAIVREVGRLAETVTWPLLSRNANGFVSQFGELRGVRMSGAPKKFEIVPYTVASVDTKTVDASDPLAKSPDPGASVGLDMKYAVRPGLTFTGTVNPDFGQVEADAAVVNLGAFETFFPERRPFFVEGSGTFRFNMDCNDGECTGLFYSRRIGRAPQGSADTADGEFAAAPTAATIIGAGKLSGRVGAFSVGALTAVTAREEAEIAAEGGLGRRAQTVEPLTAYTVLRARREFQNQSSVGFMSTVTNRQIAPGVEFLSDNAVAGGVDYDWRLSKMYNISGYWAASRITGSPEAITRLQKNNVHVFQRPDADYMELDESATSLSGHAGSVSFGKIAGETMRFNSFFGFKTPGFDSNDLGYLRRADQRMMSNWMQLRNFKPGKWVRTRNVNFNQWAAWNFGGDRLFAGGNINTHWTFTNYYSVGMGVNVEAAPLQDRATRGGPAVLGTPSLGVWYYANGDRRKALSVAYQGYHSRDRFGSSQNEFSPGVTWRATSALSVSSIFSYNRNRDDAQWVKNVSDADGRTHYVFGRLDQKTVALTFRFNYTMTPTLSLQVYAQPFVSAGDYEGYKELADPRHEDYAQRYQPYAYDGNADFNYRSFRTTNVLRWEFKPGSALFVVWQQGREESGEFGDYRFRRDFGGAFSAPARNTVMVKFSYWLNM